MRILIAEDDQVLADGLLRTLRASGAAADHVASGTEADAALMTNTEFDLLILDLGLPGGSGLDIIRDVRTWSGVPIVVLSARSDEDGKIAALDAGADNCLTKPFGIGELLAAPCTGQQRGPGAHAPPIAARSLGTVACRAKPLLAHL